VDASAQYPQDYFEAFRDAGLLGITLPRSVGGADAGTVALAVAIEEMAKFDASAGLMLLLSSLATHTVKFFGDEQQMQWYVGPVARGEKKASFCLTEPNAGSDVASMQSRARRVEGEYVITGE